MKLHLDKPLYSATDLLNFLGCSHATVLDIETMSGRLGLAEIPRDEYLDLLKEKGLEHERRYLKQLRTAGREIVEIERSGAEDSIDAMAERTRQAMRDGADVVYQGALTAPGWHGYSDFLIRVDTPSALGNYSYEVADTKLAHTAKPKHVVQLSIYSDIIATEQGLAPVHAHIVLGDDSMHTLRLHDYEYYSRHARNRFDRFVTGGERDTVAEKCQHCGLCRWSGRCAAEWDAEGNLRLVAALSAAQARKLRAAGISAMDVLGALEPDVTVKRIQQSTLEKLRTQARLQMIKRTTGENRVEVLAVEPRRGFERLPLSNEGDLFFDMEGDPVYSPMGSLEYLFGFHYVDDGENRYKAFWATDRDSEKKAFEDALDFITTRLEQYPSAFVYHYASYEQTALKRLASQYGASSRHEDSIKRLAQSWGTRENEVDDLLRNRKLVDLYKVVREGVRTSEPAYSLKNLEVFFAEKRTQDITSGGDSVVAFERWLKSKEARILDQIERYNEFDCFSTRLCRDWLLTLRPAEARWFDPEAERAEDAVALDKEKERRQDDQLILEMRSSLVEGTDGEEREWRELLGYLLEYHRREARSEWWQFFKRLDPAYDYIEDNDCIGGAAVDPTVPARMEKRSTIVRLRFPEQDFKLRKGDKPVRVDTEKGAGEIVAVNEDERWFDIKVGPSRPPFGETVSLVPQGPLNDAAMRDALRRYADALIAGDDRDFAAVTGILRKERPKLSGGPILRGERALLDETIDAIARMDRTHLVIQGPPGSGKTFTSAHAIVSLLAGGKRVGVMSMSHKAINNLLKAVEEIASERKVAFRGVNVAKDDEHKLNGSVIVDAANEEAINGGYALIGGTSWFFSRASMDKQLDYLFVDEAGQVCLANIIASGLSAKNIVLVGDQMQLSQPAKGDHPGGSGVSGLDYLMGDWRTVPSDRGIFLERSWRMHPDLCRFVSRAFYDGKLESAQCTEGQRLIVDANEGDALPGAGLAFIAVEHEDNIQRSVEEATRIDGVYRSLLQLHWVNEKGQTNQVTPDDILVVSPYNLQVNLLRQVLPEGARVGTVDKFQGQEAAVVLISMASSSADDAPRGIEFLFSANRLNVALSRARCLSVMFSSPRLLDAVCTDLTRMKLVNTVCWAREYSARA